MFEVICAGCGDSFSLRQDDVDFSDGCAGNKFFCEVVCPLCGYSEELQTEEELNNERPEGFPVDDVDNLENFKL